MGELHAELGVGSGMWEVTAGYESCGMEGARLRRPWAAAGPGQATYRHPDRLEVAAGPAGPGRGAGGRRQGQGGPRDRPLRAVRLACGDLAGGPPPTGTHSGPAHQGTATRRPEICRGNKQQAERPPPTSTRSGRARRTARAAPGTPATPHTTPIQPPGYAKGAGTEVPAPCRLTQPLPRRGLRPNDRQSWRRRRIHRNMPPTTAAPRPAPPIRLSKPVRARPWARPCFGLVAGTSGAT